MTSDDAILWREWERDGRLTPWLVSSDVRNSTTGPRPDEPVERRIVRDAISRMQHALETR